MTDSQTLLSQYVNDRSEMAFRELVTRYINLVYSTALRLVDHQSQLAEDVSQTVFIALAKKARTLPADVMLGGWLHQHTRFAAAKIMRGERRRQNRERQATEANMLEDHSKSNLDQIAPILDEAIGELGAADRTAILLRFFEKKDLQSVGEALGTSDEAARKRVNSALDKLHSLLRRRGVTLSATALATSLAADAVTVAPAQLASNISGVAFASTATGGGIAGTILTLMTWTKLKIGVIVMLLELGLMTVVPFFRSNTPKNIAQSRAGNPLKSFNTARPSGFIREAPLRVIGGDELKTAKEALRLLLDRAQSSRSYPSPELYRALANFGNQWLESLPILLEYLENPDFETRHWSLAGIWGLVMSREGKDADSLNEALGLFRPKVSAIFRAGDQPVEMRRLAFQALAQINTNVPSTPRSLDPEMRADITSVLQAPQKKSLSFQFEIVTTLSTPRMRSFPENVQMLREALDPLLQNGNSNQRLVAAYGLAALPGEKPSELKSIFLHGLDLRGIRDASYTYYAAEGLGMLGSQAKDAVPALIAFAQETKEWANGDYAERALKAVCRIQPELRAQYPIIDAKLNEEEASAQITSAAPRVITHSEMAATLSDSASGADMLKSFTDQIKESDEPAQTKAMILRMLEGLLSQSSEQHREGIKKAIGAIHLVSEQKPDENPPPPLPLLSLTLDARILLSYGGHASEARLTGLLADWDDFYRKNPAQSTLTGESFEGLSKSIKETDPVFHGKWLAEVQRTYPTLDRIIKQKME